MKRLIIILSLFLANCSTVNKSNAGGSEPINEHEAVVYNQALTRCYKTGGSRVVKIMGKLRCY